MVDGAEIANPNNQIPLFLDSRNILIPLIKNHINVIDIMIMKKDINLSLPVKAMMIPSTSPDIQIIITSIGNNPRRALQGGLLFC